MNNNIQNMYSQPSYAYHSKLSLGRYPTVAWVQMFTPVQVLQVRASVLHRGYERMPLNINFLVDPSCL